MYVTTVSLQIKVVWLMYKIKNSVKNGRLACTCASSGFVIDTLGIFTHDSPQLLSLANVDDNYISMILPPKQMFCLLYF